jgi:hypothetical protein
MKNTQVEVTLTSQCIILKLHIVRAYLWKLFSFINVTFVNNLQYQGNYTTCIGNSLMVINDELL